MFKYLYILALHC